MCFSAEVSFGASTVLAAIGGVCITQPKRARYKALAWTPMLFAVQQFAEGLTWHGLATGSETLQTIGAATFLLFAFLFWPVWMPFVARGTEPSPGRRRFLLWTLGAGVVVGLVLYVPIALDLPNGGLLPPEVCQGSIRYPLSEPIYPGYLARQALYCAVGVASLASRDLVFRLFMGGAMVAAVLTEVAYHETWTSVWCFFVAGLSILLHFFIRRDARRHGLVLDVGAARSG